MKFIAAIILLLTGLPTTWAQQLCGTDDIHHQLLKQDPTYKARVQKNDEYTLEFIKTHPLQPVQNDAATALYTIPVVVHVVHTGGAVGSLYNPSDAQIESAITYLNQVYDGTAVGMTGGVGDIQIQFVLAKRDPNCNPTNGIDRVNASGNASYVANGVNRNNTNGINDLSLKNLSRWNATQYYNIWLVNKIDGTDGTSGQFTAGYAYYPGAGTQLDGAVMLATQMKPANKVLPHEMGHALNVLHPFEGSSGAGVCPTNTNCSLNGDRVCDTDPISYNSTNGTTNFSCRTGTNPCTDMPYSINTENNIMNYTNCFTLFTAGQKARMLAAMTLSDRASLANSLGGTPTYEGSVVCQPRINFETTQTTLTETTENITECRGYKDYTFNLTISNSPSVAAVATLSVTGSALQGSDFLITTNGSFETPSNTITFPAGSHDNRPFTVRIFDDQAIEATKTIVIDYTLNAGGGNTQKGNNSTNVISITDNDITPSALSVLQAQIGTSFVQLGSVDAAQPFDAKLTSKKSLMLYRASELTAMGLEAGQITSFGIYLIKNSTRAFSNLQIKMGTTSLLNLVNNTASLVATSTVKSLDSYSTVNGLNLFALDQPFTWNGTSSIAVEICYDNGSTAAAQSNDIALGYSDGGSNTQGNFYWTNNVNCSGSFGSLGYYNTGYKPSAYFIINKTGAQTETVLNASANSYLGPNAEVYFYSANGNILARIKNLTSFDYGCTEVKIDRAGNTAKDYTGANAENKVADKTIIVTPTNSNENGHYEITLFYKPAEVNGWKTATGLLWQNAKILKTPNGVSTYPAGSISVSNVSAAVSAKGFYSTDSTITATFTNGFSGFAVGNPSLEAPVIYTFVGTGLWTLASNWSNNLIPPDILPSGNQIIINPQQNGECILNKSQTISPGATLLVQPGKSFIIQGGFQLTKP
jgi:hypothetical protein